VKKQASSNQKKDDSDTKMLREASIAYKNLVTAQREYLNALKNGNKEQQAFFSGMRSSADNKLKSIRADMDNMDSTTDAYRKIEVVVNQAANAHEN